MRKILLTASLLLAVLCADAQRVFDRAERPSGYSWREEALDYLEPGVHVYVRGGLAVASLMGKERTESGSLAGAMAEVGLEIPFRRSLFGLQPALRYVMKGGKVPWDDGDPNNTTARMNYVEVPLNVYMHLPFNERHALKLAMGPYVGVGVGGEVTHEGRSYRPFGSDYCFRRCDVGVGLEATYEYRRFQATLGAESGFVPILTADGDRSWPRPTAFYLNVGWRL